MRRSGRGGGRGTCPVCGRLWALALQPDGVTVLLAPHFDYTGPRTSTWCTGRGAPPERILGPTRLR